MSIDPSRDTDHTNRFAHQQHGPESNLDYLNIKVRELN